MLIRFQTIFRNGSIGLLLLLFLRKCYQIFTAPFTVHVVPLVIVLALCLVGGRFRIERQNRLLNIIKLGVIVLLLPPMDTRITFLGSVYAYAMSSWLEWVAHSAYDTKTDYLLRLLSLNMDSLHSEHHKEVAGSFYQSWSRMKEWSSGSTVGIGEELSGMAAALLFVGLPLPGTGPNGLSFLEAVLLVPLAVHAFNWLHPYAHTKEDQRPWLLRREPFHTILNRHRLHHRHGGLCNYNFVLGFDDLMRTVCSVVHPAFKRDVPKASTR